MAAGDGRKVGDNLQDACGDRREHRARGTVTRSRSAHRAPQRLMRKLCYVLDSDIRDKKATLRQQTKAERYETGIRERVRDRSAKAKGRTESYDNGSINHLANARHA